MWRIAAETAHWLSCRDQESALVPDRHEANQVRSNRRCTRHNASHCLLAIHCRTGWVVLDVWFKPVLRLEVVMDDYPICRVGLASVVALHVRDTCVVFLHRYRRAYSFPDVTELGRCHV